MNSLQNAALNQPLGNQVRQLACRVQRRHLVWLASGAMVVVALWLARRPVASLLAVLGDQAAVREYVLGFGVWGPVVLALTQLLQVIVAVIPGHLFMVAAGYLYGFPGGFLLNLVATVVASQLAFVLARWAGRPLVNRLVRPDVLARMNGIVEQHGLLFLAVTFTVPIFPGDVINLVAGLSSISGRRFLGASLLGRLPGAILLTLVGSHGFHLSPQAWAAAGVVLVVAVILWVSQRGLSLPRFAG